jgi:hypothetical protein
MAKVGDDGQDIARDIERCYVKAKAPCRKLTSETICLIIDFLGALAMM